MNPNIKIHIDHHGYPVFIDEDQVEFGDTSGGTSNVLGTKRGARWGNPWYDPATGQFARGPAGVRVLSGDTLMASLLNSSKQFVTLQAKRLGATALDAKLGADGHVIVTLYKAGVALTSFNVPSNQTPVGKQKYGGTDSEASHANIPPGIEPESFQRKMDAVRNAARELPSIEYDSVKEWLKGKTTRSLSEGEIDSFLDAVKNQRTNDIIDIIDSNLKRGSGFILKGKKELTLEAPRNWVNRTLQGMDDRDLAKIYERLRARGHEDKPLTKNFLGRFNETRRDSIRANITDLGTTASSSDFNRRGRDPGQAG